MDFWQIFVYSIVQGITELFPISSVAHGVILPYIAGWSNISEDPQFLPFVVMLHLGTAIALILYFWKDWWRLISSLFVNRPKDRRLLFLIIVATIPAAILGKLFEHKLRDLFPSAQSAALFLIVNGFVLLLADQWRRNRRATLTLPNISYGRSFLIGLLQVVALIPGFSRSGVTMTASLGTGLNYEEAARFSFLLATPVILGAGVLEVPKAVHAHATAMLHAGLVGGIITGVIAFISTAFLMRYFRSAEVRALRPFAYYCFIVGVVVSIMAATGIHF